MKFIFVEKLKKHFLLLFENTKHYSSEYLWEIKLKQIQNYDALLKSDQGIEAIYKLKIIFDI